MSSTLFADGKKSWEVETTTIEQLIETEKLQKEKIFVKMDIEGGEYELIPTLKALFRRHAVVLFLSIHTGFLQSVSHYKGHGTGARIFGG